MKHFVKSVLVTGGSSGIGAAAVNRMSRAGMAVYCASRSGRRPEGSPENPLVVPVVMDVNDRNAIDQVVERIVREQGHLDAVICCAGNGIAGPVEETSAEEVQMQFSTTYSGVLNTIQACVPLFRTQGFGKIVTISSIAALAPLPYQAFYSSAKAGILQLTKALAIELKPFGVQCCCILPGDVKTGFTKARRVAEKAQSEDSPYYARTIAAIKDMEHDELTGMSADRIAVSILKQLRCRSMSPEVVPGVAYKALVFLIRVLPERLVLSVIGKMYG